VGRWEEGVDKPSAGYRNASIDSRSSYAAEEVCGVVGAAGSGPVAGDDSAGDAAESADIADQAGHSHSMLADPGGRLLIYRSVDRPPSCTEVMVKTMVVKI
jgi:hypothetical protein